MPISINISIIVAMDRAAAIGFQGELPWPHNAADMAHFREKTMGKAVIMGRRTFESIPNGPLSGRTNIVVSSSMRPGWHETATRLPPPPGTPPLIAEHQMDVRYGRFYVARSVRDAILAAMRFCAEDEIMVIGGAQVYREALPLATKMYITRVPGVHAADTLFPIIPEFLPEWRVRMVDELSDQGGLVFETWERREDVWSTPYQKN